MARPLVTKLIALAASVSLLYLFRHLVIPQLWAAETADSIPNQVNFVYVLDDANSDLAFQFSHFLCVYAAWHHLHPHTILLHTNAGAEAVARARAGQAGKWARLILEMPELEVRPVTNPTHTDSGKELRFAEHRSDFARVAAVRDSGGVYLDFDVFALRDVRPLRETGFAAIVGREVTDQVNSGIFMTRHHSTLISAWAAEMHRDYDGGWLTHSNLALTRIAERLVAAPREVLIMERHALDPGGWGNDDYDRLWGVHDDVPSALAGVNPGDPLPPDASPPPQWAIDWSRTYLLHAFMPYRAHYTVKGFDYISPRYVLERRSNFARALSPVVRLMYERGLVDIDDPYHGRPQADP